MIAIKEPIQERFKKAAKRTFPELKDRNDYEIKIVEINCQKCGGQDKTSAYRLYHKKVWNVKRKTSPCNRCQDLEYLKNYQRDHRIKVKNGYVVLCAQCLKTNTDNYEVKKSPPHSKSSR